MTVSLEHDNNSSWLYTHRLGLVFGLILLLVVVWLLWSVTSPSGVEINSMGG